MKTRHFNLVVLVVLIAGIAVFAIPKSVTKPKGSIGKQSSSNSPELEPEREGVIRTHKNLPILASGPVHGEHLEIRPKCDVQVGSDTYTLDHSEISLNGEVMLVKDFSWPTGMTYDSKRHRLVVSSLGGEGLLDFYDLKQEKWLDPVALNNIDLTRILYSPETDTFFSLNADHGENQIIALYEIDGNSGEVTSKDLEYPIIGVPATLGWEGDSLVIGGRFVVDPKTGGLTAEVRKGYDGEETAVVAVYEASSNHEIMADFVVNVAPTAPSHLVLSAYEGVRWKIRGGAQLKSILVNGYEPCEVVGAPDGSEVKVSYYPEADELLPMPHEVQSAEMGQLLQALEQKGLGVDRIAAAYQAQEAFVE